MEKNDASPGLLTDKGREVQIRAWMYSALRDAAKYINEPEFVLRATKSRDDGRMDVTKSKSEPELVLRATNSRDDRRINVAKYKNEPEFVLRAK